MAARHEVPRGRECRQCADNVYDINIAAEPIREMMRSSMAIRYLGIEKREEIQIDEHLPGIEYRINRWSGKLPKVLDNAIDWDHYISYG